MIIAYLLLLVLGAAGLGYVVGCIHGGQRARRAASAIHSTHDRTRAIRDAGYHRRRAADLADRERRLGLVSGGVNRWRGGAA